MTSRLLRSLLLALVTLVVITVSSCPMSGCTVVSAQDLSTTNNVNSNCPSNSLPLIRMEADYITKCQFMDSNNAAFGAINDVAGNPTWIVPREMSLAILALIKASKCLNDGNYLKRAYLAGDYLIRIQQNDGSWCDQYSYEQVSTKSKSPTQTAEVVMGLSRLILALSDSVPQDDYQRMRLLNYWASIKNGLLFLNRLQDVNHKTGLDDGLVCGGIRSDGVTYETWRWSSDNSFAYQAFAGAAHLARYFFKNTADANRYTDSAAKILKGIDQYLKDPRSPVWYQAVDNRGQSYIQDYNWINYAPTMINVPARGANDPQVGHWIAGKLRDPSTGAVFQDSNPASVGRRLLSPGFSFQASFVWYQFNQQSYINSALAWVEASGLYQKTPDSAGIAGGWVDWYDMSTKQTSGRWERFIDTSFYAICAYTGGYDFSVNSMTVNKAFW